jgi:hypothetical protein
LRLVIFESASLRSPEIPDLSPPSAAMQVVVSHPPADFRGSSSPPSTDKTSTAKRVERDPDLR